MTGKEISHTDCGTVKEEGGLPPCCHASHEQGVFTEAVGPTLEGGGQSFDSLVKLQGGYNS